MHCVYTQRASNKLYCIQPCHASPRAVQRRLLAAEGSQRHHEVTWPATTPASVLRPSRRLAQFGLPDVGRRYRQHAGILRRPAGSRGREAALQMPVSCVRSVVITQGARNREYTWSVTHHPASGKGSSASTVFQSPADGGIEIAQRSISHNIQPIALAASSWQTVSGCLLAWY